MPAAGTRTYSTSRLAQCTEEDQVDVDQFEVLQVEVLQVEVLQVEVLQVEVVVFVRLS